LARERAKSVLLQELQNRAELLQTKDAIVKELQERLNTTVQALEDARSEVARLVKQRDAELPDSLTKNGPAKEQAEGLLKPDRKGMNSKLLELGAAKALAAASLPAVETKHGSGPHESTIEAPGEILGEVQDQGVLPDDKNEFLEADDGFKTDLTKKERH
jgi:hypothetical protein